MEQCNHMEEKLCLTEQTCPQVLFMYCKTVLGAYRRTGQAHFQPFCYVFAAFPSSGPPLAPPSRHSAADEAERQATEALLREQEDSLRATLSHRYDSSVHASAKTCTAFHNERSTLLSESQRQRSSSSSLLCIDVWPQDNLL